ncbi:hypothetical protein RB195_019673 [Necator americanus]|uniref:Major facilitator superfamily (MFS) profile domain-containing protein n=1 Tax=Necator americanus TaxID=51031 RepID=A0ABR1CHT4_NECAM
MVTTRLTNEVLDNCTGLDIIRKPEDILDKLGTRHVGLIVAIVSCSFVWGFGALSIMSSAFTSIDCGNCTDTMVTVVSEFDLRGERSYLIEWSTSFFMIGNMIGGCTLSHAADRFGRRPIMLLCLTFQALSALLASLSTSVHIFSVCRLLQGTFYTGANLVAWVAAYENTHTDSRSFTTFLFGAAWVVGYSVTALIVYLSYTWRRLMITTSLSTLVFTVWCWKFVPETLHFLVSKRNTTRIHKWFMGIDYSPQNTDIANLLDRDNDSPSSQRSSFFHEIWNHKIFIVYCFIQLYLWTCDNFIYFGLSLYSTQLAGNTYANYLLMGLVELPAYVLGPISLEKFGRKVVVSGTHFLAAVCFLLPVFSEAGSWISLCCWLLGKFSISCSFMSLFVYASEIFPTPIRNVSVGLCSVLSRGGAIAAPYIRLLGSISATSPMFLLAALSFLAGALTCLLPETHRKPLPANISQAAPVSSDLLPS